MELLDHMVMLFAIFSVIAILLLTAGVPFCILTNRVRVFQFPYILINTCFLGIFMLFCFVLFYHRHPNECEVLYHRGLDLRFLKH